MKNILVTGGNTGIGFALCKQLAVDRNCHVLLSARSTEKGTAATKKINDAIRSKPGCTGGCEFVLLDTSKDASVQSAAMEVQSKLNGLQSSKLYAIVNNAGIGLSTSNTPEDVVNTNLYGPKRVCDAFWSVLDPAEGRVVNVGSGAGPMYVQRCGMEDKRVLSDPSRMSMEFIERHARQSLGSAADTMGGYGLSKALLACYTVVLAKDHPHILSSVVSPGFIDTNMTRGYGASKSPEEGTVSILKCLFADLKGNNGCYYGSDGLRSPLHYMRNPGEPEYDGVVPF